MAKRISNEKLLGEEGVALVAKRLSAMGFPWHPTNAGLEGGIDGYFELRDSQTGELSGSIVLLQSKARSALEHETASSLSFTCSQRDLEYWLTGNAPVLLVVSRPRANEAWWVSIKDYFTDPKLRRSRRITFNKERDAFNETAAERLRAIGTVGGGAYFTPLPRTETLISNLLRVSRLPEQIFTAYTDHRTPKALHEVLKAKVEWPPREWMLKDKKLYSVHNLREPPWNQVCDVGTVDALGIDEWRDSDDPQTQRDFVQLLNRCFESLLGKKRIRYRRDCECYCFKPNRDLSPRIVRYRARQNLTSRDVVRAYMRKSDPASIGCYRHVAFETGFRCYNGTWYLELNPTYVFTSDGWALDPYHQERLSGIKRQEGDGAVAGTVWMMRQLLRDTDGLFAEPYPHLGFDELAQVEIGVGIRDADWSGADELMSAARQVGNGADAAESGELFDP